MRRHRMLHTFIEHTSTYIQRKLTHVRFGARHGSRLLAFAKVGGGVKVGQVRMTYTIKDEHI